MNIRITTVLPAIIMLGIGQNLMAQQAVEIVADSPGNRFYGQYEAIEDHPDCQGADRVAFNVPLIADQVDFQIFDPVANASAAVGVSGFDPGPSCYITQGFGVNRIEVEISCGPDTPERLQRRIDTLDVLVGLRGHLTACLSPMGVTFLDSEWAVTVADTEREEVHKGGGIEQSPASSGITIVGPKDAPVAKFQYLYNGFGVRGWHWQSRDHPLVQSLRGVSGVRVEVDCVPVDSFDDGDSPLFLGFRASIAVVDAHAEACTGPDCPSHSRAVTLQHAGMGENCVAR